MKAVLFCLVLAAGLASCQDEGSLSQNQEQIWKKRSDGSQSQNANTNDPNDPAHAPIDGGLSVLLVAGAAYGVKRYRDQKKAKPE